MKTWRLENNYEIIPDLEHVYLEDSFVLAMDETFGKIEFVLDAVLIETHPVYSPPRSGEQYCLLKSKLAFQICGDALWHCKEFRAYTDANGEIDYGNIDTFSIMGDEMRLVGDWGDVQFRCIGVQFQPILAV